MKKIYVGNLPFSSTEDEIRQVEASLISRDTLTEERVLLLVDLKDLSERTGQLEAEIVELIEDRAVSEEQLAQYEAMIADANY